MKLKQFAKFACIGVAAIGLYRIGSTPLHAIFIPDMGITDVLKASAYQFASPSFMFGNPLYNPISSVVLGMEILGTAIIGKKLFSSITKNIIPKKKFKKNNVNLNKTQDNHTDTLDTISNNHLKEDFLTKEEKTTDKINEVALKNSSIDTINSVLNNISTLRKQRENVNSNNKNFNI